MLRWFIGKWRVAKEIQVEHLHLCLYTRQGCHLCDVAWEQLQRWQRQYRFHLQSADVDQNAVWQQAYGLQVPVVTVNGKVRFRGRINPVLFRRLMAAEGRRARAEHDDSM